MRGGGNSTEMPLLADGISCVSFGVVVDDRTDLTVGWDDVGVVNALTFIGLAASARMMSLKVSFMVGQR